MLQKRAKTEDMGSTWKSFMNMLNLKNIVDTMNLTIVQSRAFGIVSNKPLYNCGIKSELDKLTHVYISHDFI